MRTTKELLRDLAASILALFVIVGHVYAKNMVYMQLYTAKEANAPVRSLSRDSKMTEEECLENKARVEKPLSAGGGYSIPSGYTVDCIPVEYLDGESKP